MRSCLFGAPGPSTVAGLLGQYRFRHVGEKQLQHGVAVVLKQHNIPYEREYKLPSRGGRIDFFLTQSSCGLEVKIDGGHSEVARQIHRYMRQPCIKSMILLTTRKRHEILLPQDINGKPLYVVCLWLQAL